MAETAKLPAVRTQGCVCLEYNSTRFVWQGSECGVIQVNPAGFMTVPHDSTKFDAVSEWKRFLSCPKIIKNP